MFLASECWSVDVNETEEEVLFWEIGLDLGKEKYNAEVNEKY